MNEEKFSSLIVGIGALAEMSSLYFKGLVNNGISNKDAALMTSNLIGQIITASDNRSDDLK